MASPQDVQNYLAHWFQLGKSVHIGNEIPPQRPMPVLEGQQFSRAFHECWQLIIDKDGQNCYLEGSQETIEQLLSAKWEITDCARCAIPIAIPTVMPVAQACLCEDLTTWPNNELPAPHMPINSAQHLSRLKSRLKMTSQSNPPGLNLKSNGEQSAQ